MSGETAEMLKRFKDVSGDVERLHPVPEHRLWRSHLQSPLIRSGFTSLGSALQETPDSESSFPVRFTFTALQLHMMSMTNMLSWFHASALCCHVTSSSHIMLQLQRHLTSFLSFEVVNLQLEKNLTCWC